MLERRGVPVAEDETLSASVLRFDAIVDARHPYAEPLAATSTPRLRLLRAPWAPTAADRWVEKPDAAAIRARLGAARRVFVTLGRAFLPPFANDPARVYFFRVKGDAELGAVGSARFIVGRGPYDAAGEAALFRDLAVDALVSRNDGSRGAAPKILAARALGLPVFFLRRPPFYDPFATSPRVAARWAAMAATNGAPSSGTSPEGA